MKRDNGSLGRSWQRRRALSAIQNTGQNKLIVIIFLHYAAFTPIINNTKTQVGIRESSQIIK